MERMDKGMSILSPLVFTLVANGLSRLMDRAMEVGFVKSCKVGKDNVMISHLQFTDDTIFFVDSNGSSFNNLVSLLGLFYSASRLKINNSRLKINNSKSILLGLGVDQHIVTSLAELVGCEVGLWPTTYLGMPLGGNPCSRTFGNQLLIR